MWHVTKVRLSDVSNLGISSSQLLCPLPSTFLPRTMMTTPEDNPYLQHLAPHRRAGPIGAASAAAKEPLYGFLARHVTADQVTKAMVRIL
jgi:hypothetical protein